MPVFIKNNHSILFIHIPKTGGGSICDLFEKNGYTLAYHIKGVEPQASLSISPQHLNLRKLKLLVNLNEFSDIFTIVRNPYDRLISEFKWQFRNHNSHLIPDLNDWICNSLEIVKKDPTYADGHFMPMVNFLDKNIPCRIFKFEDGLNIVAQLYSQQYNFDWCINLARLHNSHTFPKNHYSSKKLNKRAILCINKFYKHDFHSFSYPKIRLSKNIRNQSLLDLLPLPNIFQNWYLNTLRECAIILVKRRCEDSQTFRQIKQLNSEIEQMSILIDFLVDKIILLQSRNNKITDELYLETEEKLTILERLKENEYNIQISSKIIKEKDKLLRQSISDLDYLYRRVKGQEEIIKNAKINRYEMISLIQKYKEIKNNL
ncbi:sulfotransferase family 2 domain-containing protein [Synechococcus sp. M16CYN]|uniref:sulfotransferase family 2 domain-containing protein n=1 Tax=Synechococcus sp. M16CYN TaxID=3103139 RepID=UPI0030DFB5B8